MKAVVYRNYGPPEVLQLVQLAKPTPKPNEVLIKVRLTTVTSGDVRVRSLNVPTGFKLISRLVFGLTKPRQPILGSELVGAIEAVGADVCKFKVGEQVFAFSDAAMGCYAQYKCMPEHRAIAIKPPQLADDLAVSLSFGGTTALSFFKRANLQRGESVLINGASGAVGSAAVQLAKHFGAIVTAVCSTANVSLVRALGADQVIDYTRLDFTSNGETYDLVMDCVGTAPFLRVNKSLKSGGCFLMVLGGLPDMLKIPWQTLVHRKKIVAGPAAGRAEDLRFLAELAQDGAFKPVIDRRYRFEEMVAAHRYVDTGRKRGNVVVAVTDLTA